jgi:hypothetical protein
MGGLKWEERSRVPFRACSVRGELRGIEGDSIPFYTNLNMREFNLLQSFLNPFKPNKLGCDRLCCCTAHVAGRRAHEAGATVVVFSRMCLWTTMCLDVGQGCHAKALPSYFGWYLVVGQILSMPTNFWKTMPIFDQN